MTKLDGLDFSFSGIKTAVINLRHKNPDVNKEDLCASFEETVTKMLLNNVEKVIKEYHSEKIALAGGVSRNSYIRAEFDKMAKKEGIKVYYPEPILCTDNAAMIAAQGYYDYIADQTADLHLNAVPNLKL